jgi:hypothetical protein
VELSKDKFQTCSMIMARVTRRPVFRMRYSSSANSFEVSSIGLAPPSHAPFDWVECEIVYGEHGIKRQTARPQQRDNSEKENGFTR